MAFKTGLNRLPPHLAAAHARLAAIPLARRIAMGRLGAGRIQTMAPDLTAFVPLMEDQGQTSSCVGHGGSGATAAAVSAAVALGQSTRALSFVPSPRDLYANCRILERMSSRQALTDSGANIGDLITVVTRIGVRPMRGPTADNRNSDVDEANVNAEETLLELEEDDSYVLLDVNAHPIATGPTMFEEIAYALSIGAPVLIGVPGGSSTFQNYDGAAPLDAIAEPVDHCVFLHKADLAAGADGLLEGTNSWGLIWGRMGRFQATRNFLSCTADAYALSVRLP